MLASLPSWSHASLRVEENSGRSVAPYWHFQCRPPPGMHFLSQNLAMKKYVLLSAEGSVLESEVNGGERALKLAPDGGSQRRGAVPCGFCRRHTRSCCSAVTVSPPRCPQSRSLCRVSVSFTRSNLISATFPHNTRRNCQSLF